MINLDGTKQKIKLGANAILAVSMANKKLSANTINEEFAQKYQPKKELSPLKEATQDKHDGEPKMDLTYRYGSMFVIPTLEPSTKTGSEEEDLDDDLSLESLHVDF